MMSLVWERSFYYTTKISLIIDSFFIHLLLESLKEKNRYQDAATVAIDYGKVGYIYTTTATTTLKNVYMTLIIFKNLGYRRSC